MDREQFVFTSAYDGSKTVTYKEVHLALSIPLSECKRFSFAFVSSSFDHSFVARLINTVYEKNKDRFTAIYCVTFEDSGVSSILLMDDGLTNLCFDCLQSLDQFSKLDKSKVKAAFIHSIGRKEEDIPSEEDSSSLGVEKMWDDLRQEPSDWAS